VGFEEYEPSEATPPRRRLRLILIGIVVLFAAFMTVGQTLWFYFNIMEFGELYIRPIYFGILSGLVLSAIAFFRVDFRNRRSLFWWAIRLGLRLIREVGAIQAIPPHYLDFKVFKLSHFKFAAWQVTKVLAGMLFFANVVFGMALHGLMQGWDPGLNHLWRLFRLPFITPPPDMAYAQANVVPMVPSLTLIATPILGALGIRLILLVGITQIARVLTPSTAELEGEKPHYGWRIVVVESLAALMVFWAMVNSFFSSFIDYNTKVVIGALAAVSGIFIFFACIDGVKRKGLITVARRPFLLRLLAVFIIVIMAGSVMAVQNSIADAKKIEWRGPYTAQQIAVNRYLAELDAVEEIPYEFGIKVVSPERIPTYAAEHRELLSKIRLWDWQAASAKLKPEIGLIPYLDFEDSDILRFEDTLYWSYSMKPILPQTVRTEDRWYAQRLVYTHVPAGYLILDANTGTIVSTERFFQQRRIYYGEGGLFSETWVAYPLGRERSDELGGFFYDGRGGIDAPPPLSWIFDANFFWAYRGETIHALRYRDVYERMQLLFPYFEYKFGEENVDMLPVTDGVNTYWLMPLIVRLDGQNVPWSGGNPLMRLVGYALIDIYHGEIQLLILGDDYFSELFEKAYSEYVVAEVPDWLKKQLRYPEELFEWRISMYNYFHITDPSTFIVAKEFFEVPKELDTYYIIAQPPGFEKPEYVGLLSLELRGAGGRNLAGYMIVRNDYENFGEMVFYKVDIESPTKLLGPTAVLEAMEKNPDFAKLKTLLREPIVGDNIFYRVGDYDVYFIPVYTAGASGVVAELGTIVAVGAAFTGKYYVGLGNTVEDAFEAYLAQLAGLEAPPPVVEVGKEQRLADILKLFEDRGLTVVEPKAVHPHLSFQEGEVSYVSEDQWDATKELVNSFIERWGEDADKVLMWTENSKINFGVLVDVKGVIVELHYITISLEE